MTRHWTQVDKMMVVVGKLTEKYDLLAGDVSHLKDDVERMRDSINRGALLLSTLPPSEQQIRKGRKKRLDRRRV